MNKPLSREYLLKQGRCCNNGCTNCPYKENNMKFRSIISKKYKVKLKDLTSIWNTEGRYDYAEKWPEYTTDFIIQICDWYRQKKKI